MSSAILYLAIVAIWACVLVPRWLHRSHENPSGEEVLADSDEAADPDEDPGTRESDPADEPDEEVPAYAAPGALAAGPAQAGSVAQTYVAVETEIAVHAEFVTGSGSGFAGRPESAGHADAAWPDPQDAAGPPGETASRARILQSRRRLLTLLVVLAAVAVGFTIDGLTAWWIIIAPAGMLGVYLLLLREAAQADAEITLRQAEDYAAAEAAHTAQVAQERAREALAAHAPQPTAEIIDISARTAQAKDQLYDQYADAAVRAVGD